jgi:hypothetical protein
MKPVWRGIADQKDALVVQILRFSGTFQGTVSPDSLYSLGYL